MLGLLGHATSFAKRKMNLGYRAGAAAGRLPARALPARRSAATNSTMRRLIAAGDDEPLADIADGQGQPLGASGGRRGHVTGTFFHAIAKG